MKATLKVLSVVLALCMVFVLASCAGKTKPANTDETTAADTKMSEEMKDFYRAGQKEERQREIVNTGRESEQEDNADEENAASVAAKKTVLQ